MKYLRPITIGIALALSAVLLILALLIYRWKQPEPGTVYLKPGVASGAEVRDGLVTQGEKYVTVLTSQYGEELFAWDQIRYVSIRRSYANPEGLVNRIDLISKLAFAATIALFVIGLWQYRQAQKWKREEFLITAVKEFSDSKVVRNARHMLDSLALFKDGRKIELFPDAEVLEKRRVFVTNEEIYEALTPTPHEDLARDDDHAVVIRECFDAFLSELITFYHHIEQKLITKEGLRANIGYWIDLLGPDGGLRPDYHRRIFAYAETYGMTEVEELIRAYHPEFKWEQSIPKVFVLRHFKTGP